MIQFGSLDYAELRFQQLRAAIELRDSQWIDVELYFELEPGSKLPEGLTELSALLICTYAGDIAQIVPQDEGRDCEFQFTSDEKAQLVSYYESSVRSRLEAQASKQL